MGSYKYTDFVTGLPIFEWSKKTYVLIASKKVERPIGGINTINITDHYTPVTFPLFGIYVGYGRFELDEDFKKQNDYALNDADIDLLDNEGFLNEKHLGEKNVLMSATLYEFYMNVVFGQEMPNQTEWIGELEGEQTHQEIFDKRVHDLGEWKTIVEEKINQLPENETMDNAQILSEHEGHPILYPDVQKLFLFNELSFWNTPRTQKQIQLYETIQADEDMYRYFLAWYCFYRYMEYASISFQPITITGSDMHFDYRKRKEMELMAYETLKKEYDAYMEDYS